MNVKLIRILSILILTIFLDSYERSFSTTKFFSNKAANLRRVKCINEE